MRWPASLLVLMVMLVAASALGSRPHHHKHRFASKPKEAVVNATDKAAAKPVVDVHLTRLVNLRKLMAKHKLSAYIIPTSDAHQSSWLTPADKRREYLSGFDGSAGIAVVTPNAALLWTDGRYWEQAKKQLNGNWTLMEDGRKGVPNVFKWLEDGLLKAGSLPKKKADDKKKKKKSKKDDDDEEDDEPVAPTPLAAAAAPKPPPASILRPRKNAIRIGFNANLMSLSGFQRLLKTVRAVRTRRSAAQRSNYRIPPRLTLVPFDEDLIDTIWKKESNHPGRSVKKDTVFVHKLKYAGVGVGHKLKEVREAMHKQNSQVLVISDLAQIAWLYNLRGSEYSYSPIFSAFSIVTDRAAYLFIDKDKLKEESVKHLKHFKVDVKSYDDVCINLKRLAFIVRKGARQIWLDPLHVSYRLFSCSVTSKDDRDFREQGVHPDYVHFGESPITLLKSQKNTAELEGMRQAHIRDGAALTTFFSWLSIQLSSNTPVNETSAAKELASFRAMQDEFVGLSFPAISAVGPNSALAHYRPHASTAAKITNEAVYLIDSGGQYHDGTTDVTRALHFGSPTKEEKTAYTRVLQGMIALTRVTFPEGTAGPLIDALARAPLWAEGNDFLHGTGHGIGAFLNVHEGPQAVSRISQATAVGNKWITAEMLTGLKPGMIISNEPGEYFEGKFGIRIENVIAVVNDTSKSPFGGRSFCKFETLTMAPLDAKLIDTELLSPAEIKWINEYHATVKAKLTPVLEKFKPRSPAFSNAIAYLNKATESIA